MSDCLPFVIDVDVRLNLNRIPPRNINWDCLVQEIIVSLVAATSATSMSGTIVLGQNLRNDTHLVCLIFKPSPSVDEVVKMESVCLHMVTACETVR